MADLGRCRACRAPIKWARTEKGNAIPLDPGPRTDGNLELVPGKKDVVRVVRLDSPPSDFRWVTHFVTCPARRQMRKGEARRALARTKRKDAAAQDQAAQLEPPPDAFTAVAALEAVQRVHRAPGGRE